MDLSEIINHLGEDKSQYQNAIAPPIFQSSNFKFDTVADLRTKIADEFTHTLYTRGNNPTVALLRKKLAALENAEDALVVSSGAAAIAFAILANVKTGDHIVCVQKPYSWTYKLITKWLPRFGVQHTFVDGTSMTEIENALLPETTVLFLESPNSLTYEVQDLKSCADLAKRHNITTIIDNSHCSPYYQNPIDFGIDVVVHSGTKYLNGHSDVVNGVICSSRAMIRKIFEGEFMTLGGIISPNDAWLVLRGLRTFPLRMERSENSCMKIIEWLQKHPAVEEIFHPLLPDNEHFNLARSQMRGAGGLFSVKVKGQTMEAVEAFCDGIKTFTMAASWGGYESLMFPTCGLYGVEGMDAPPLPWNFIRFYVGLEDPDFLIADLKSGLDKLVE